jgi:hypothetical protein
VAQARARRRAREEPAGEPGCRGRARPASKCGWRRQVWLSLAIAAGAERGGVDKRGSATEHGYCGRARPA